MAIVRVRNKNTYPFEQKFKGDWIRIAPDQSIEMDECEARQFIAQYSPRKLDASGRDLPEGYKMLEIEEITPREVLNADLEARFRLTCAACTEQFRSQGDLDRHILETHSHLIRDQQIVQALRAKGDGSNFATAQGPKEEAAP